MRSENFRELAFQQAARSRREFLLSSASGLGAVGLGSMLTNEGLLANDSTSLDAVNPLAPKQPHFDAKAKACIFIFMAGAPSHLDLFDPKPELMKLHGQSMPESMLKGVRFAFLKPETATLMAPTSRTFQKHGECGMELSDLLPHIGTVADDILLVRSMHTDQFNHHPGQLLMQCGRASFGLPTMGSWMTYGLGSHKTCRGTSSSRLAAGLPAVPLYGKAGSSPRCMRVSCSAIRGNRCSIWRTPPDYPASCSVKGSTSCVR